MFPNFRLLVGAVIASVVALSCGFGLFAAFRINHEPLGRLPADTAPLQLVANEVAAPVAAWGASIDARSRLSDAGIGGGAPPDAPTLTPVRQDVIEPPNPAPSETRDPHQTSEAPQQHEAGPVASAAPPAAVPLPAPAAAPVATLAPAPIASMPAPVASASAPAASAPSPVESTPAPIENAPAPIPRPEASAQTASTPAPAESPPALTPAPTSVPIAGASAPTETATASVGSAPAPTSTPKATAAEPTPTASSAAAATSAAAEPTPSTDTAGAPASPDVRHEAAGKGGEPAEAAVPPVAAIEPATVQALPTEPPAENASARPETTAPEVKVPAARIHEPRPGKPRQWVRKPVERPREAVKRRIVRRAFAPVAAEYGGRSSTFDAPVFESAPSFQRQPQVRRRTVGSAARNSFDSSFAWPSGQ